MTRVLTFGHGTADADRIVELLHGAGVRQLVDVRTAPGSRRNPHVARSEMERWLPAAGIAYRWERRLGGWRKSSPDSPDSALRNDQFRGYAGHMRSPKFAAGVDALLDEAREQPTAAMCSESVWWRCHRKLLADFLVLVRGAEVGHLMHDGTVREHRVSPEARRDPASGLLVYDAGQQPLVVE